MTRSSVLVVLGAVLVMGASTSVGQAGYLPGLYEGRVPGAFNLTDPNPCTAIRLSPRMAETSQKPPWGDNETWIYTGQIYDDDGVFSMAENIDDNIRIVIDGGVRLLDSHWDLPTTTGILNLGMGPAGDGWHDIEIRVGNAGGGAGPVADDTGWTLNFGLGYAADGTNSTRGDLYGLPVDPGNMSRLRVGAVPEPATLSLLALGGLAVVVRRRKKS